MLPNILYPILYLPLLILAYPPRPRLTAVPTVPQAANLQSAKVPTNISAPTGDTLNRTACFCASPTWESDKNYGFYYKIDYYNAHLDEHYVLEPTCQSRISLNVEDKYNPKDKPVLQNACLRSRFHTPTKFCTLKESGAKTLNTFCYTFAGGSDYDTWAFNGQHRTGLPLEPEVNYAFSVVEDVCEASCKKRVGGMEFLKGDAMEVLKGNYTLVGERLWSSVVFYPSIPDMCKGCK